MMSIIPVEKDQADELPVPSVWRDTLNEIVDAFVAGDLHLRNTTSSVHPLSDSEAKRIASNIEAYGDSVVHLPETVWETSIYRWMGGYWQVLVDLHTQNEKESDLALFVRVYESKEGFYFVVDSVHVP